MNEVLRYFTQYTLQIKNEATRSSYAAFVRSFEKFLDGKALTFEEITPELTADYQQWMILNGRTRRYIMRLGKHFRKLYRSAVAAGLAQPDNAAFSWVKNVTERGTELKSLKGQTDTTLQLRALLNKDLTEKKPLERVRDLFLLAVLTGGLTFEELYALKNSALEGRCLTVECDGEQRKITLSPLAEELLAGLRRADHTSESWLLPCFQDTKSVSEAKEQWKKGVAMVFCCTLERNYESDDTLTAQLCESAMKDAGVELNVIKAALCHTSNTSLASLNGTEPTYKDVSLAYDTLSNAVKDIRKKWYAVMMILDYQRFEQLLEDEGLYNRMETYYPMEVISRYTDKKRAEKQDTALKRILFVHTTDAQIAEFASAIRTRGFVYKCPGEFGNRYAVIRDSVMKEFRLILSHGEDFEATDFVENNNLRPNDNVTITGDDFAGKDALIIKKVGKDKYQVKLLNTSFTVKYVVSKAFIKKK